MKKKLIAMGIAFAVLISYAFINRTDRSDPQGQPLKTVRVTRTDMDRSVTATGVISPVVGAEVVVGSRVSGVVKRLHVRVGDEVRAGELLAELDATELRAIVAQAQAEHQLAAAQFQLADLNLGRQRELFDRSLITQAEFDQTVSEAQVAKARLAAEKARLESAQISLGYTRISAPIDGIIASVETREGETVAASFTSPNFVTIIDLKRLEVQAYVDETDIGRVFIGQGAVFTVDTYPDTRFETRVRAIQPGAEIQNGVVNYVILLDLDSTEGYNLRPEMTTHLDLVIETRRKTLTVPRSSLYRQDGQSYVTVLREGVRSPRKVRVGWRTDTRAEITDGLAEGDEVIVN